MRFQLLPVIAISVFISASLAEADPAYTPPIRDQLRENYSLTFPDINTINKSPEEVLFEKMAPWVFVEFKQVKGVSMGRFLNTTDRRKTGWLVPGKTLEGATLVRLNADRARVVYRNAYQDLLLVPEKAPSFDSSRRRTPEEITAAQRRYSEFYMKKFIVSGKEYARQRGNLSAPQREWFPKP